MAAFADFLDLRTEVVERVGSSTVVDNFPRLVALAEVAINRGLRCREQITETTLTFASGSATLPSDFLEVIGLYDSSGYEYVAQPPQAVRATSGTGHFFKVLASTIKMTAGDGDRTLEYYANIPSVGDSMDDTNWLLQKHPGVYLYAVAAEAANYMNDAAKLQGFQQMLGSEVAAANNQDYAERYSRGRVRVGGVTP